MNRSKPHTKHGCNALYGFLSTVLGSLWGVYNLIVAYISLLPLILYRLCCSPMCTIARFTHRTAAFSAWACTLLNDLNNCVYLPRNLYGRFRSSSCFIDFSQMSFIHCGTIFSSHCAYARTYSTESCMHRSTSSEGKLMSCAKIVNLFHLTSSLPWSSIPFLLFEII